LEPLGHTRLRDRLLSAMGWQVVSIPFFEWERLLQIHERDAYVERRVYREGPLPRAMRGASDPVMLRDEVSPPSQVPSRVGLHGAAQRSLLTPAEQSVIPLAEQVRQCVCEFAIQQGEILHICTASGVLLSETLTKRVIDSACKAILNSLEERQITSYSLRDASGQLNQRRKEKLRAHMLKLVLAFTQ
jgi:hypothetical protein